MEPVDNNQFEIIPNSKIKRKIIAPRTNVYLNPGLDLLANEDPMCNTVMEIVPSKKRKRSKSCDIVTFDNTALDLGISKSRVNELLAHELQNVCRNLRCESSVVAGDNESECINNTLDLKPETEIIDAPVLDTSDSIEISKIDDLDSGISILDNKSHNVANGDNVAVSQPNIFGEDESEMSTIGKLNITHASVTKQTFINHNGSLNLSFIDKLALDSPNANQSLYLDDDLNESNIMEIKQITIITKKKIINDPRKAVLKKNTNPFLEPDDNAEVVIPTHNPFLDVDEELEYIDDVDNKQEENTVNDNNEIRPDYEPMELLNPIMPRRLFASDTNSTISTVNESLNLETVHEYENIDNYRINSPIYENVQDMCSKQSKILGYDVSQFGARDILNLNKTSSENSSTGSDDSKNSKLNFLRAGNRLSKRVLKKLKKTFKVDKQENNITLNPYEVPRKPPKQKKAEKEAGIENPALNLDNSDEIEIEEMDDDEEHQYETIKTLRNTQLNMNVTPLRERSNESEISQNRTYTPGKKVRFDSTLNREKVITGNSFDYSIQSPGFDVKIDKYHDELENCINERKFLQQNM